MSASRKGRRPSFTPRSAGSGSPDDGGSNGEDARDDDWADIYSGGDAGAEGEVNRTTNVEQAVADGEGREVLHPDGSLTRVGAETVTSLAAGEASTLEDGSRGRVRLAAGSLWHEADPDSPAGQTFEVELASGRIVTRDATFGVMCEADGSCFITAVAGEVTVEANQSRPMQLAPLEAVMYSPTGEFLDAIRAEPEELMADPWIGRNLRLSDLDPSAVRLPSMVATRPAAPPPPAAEPEVTDEADTTVAGDAAAAAAAAGLAGATLAGSAGETETIDTTADDAAETGDEPHDGDEAATSTGVLDAEVAAAAVGGAAGTAAWGAEAGADAATLEDDADAPEVVVPTAVIAGAARADDEDELDEYEEGEPPGRTRTIVALFLILAGAVLVLIVILSWIGRSSGNKVDTASESSTTVSTTATTVKPGGTTAVPPTTLAPGTTAKPGGPTTTAAPGTTTPPSTAPPTTTAGGNKYTVHPTRCSQTGNQLTAEGNVTNLDTVAHSYKIEVVFTTDNGNTVATTATATVQHAPPNVATSWSTTSTYAPDLAKTGGGCRIGNVTILD